MGHWKSDRELFDLCNSNLREWIMCEREITKFSEVLRNLA